MSSNLPQDDALLARLEDHLSEAGYSASAVSRQRAVAKGFLQYLDRQHIPIESAQPLHVTMYLRRQLRRFVRAHGRSPRSIGHWRASYTGGIHQLLRMIKGQWPTGPLACSAFESFGQVLCAEYGCWLDERRGLAAETVHDLLAEARRLLSWYGDRATSHDLQGLSVADINAYQQARAPSLRRVSRKSVAQRLRCFMRFAYATGKITHDLAGFVMAPTLYALESIPSALASQQIDAVVRTCREDRSPKGRRDYAIVMLLATYGLRAGEIVRLRLDDIDWRTDRLHIRHSKTGSHSVLPLLPAVGAALLAYLRRGRPRTNVREVFVRAHAPYQGFDSGSTLYTPIRRRLDQAGVQTVGKRGPHAFRHARAVSLLRSGVPPKIIGDVLGHRSAASTTPYLKLATEELRGVALEVSELLGENAS